VLIVLGLWAMNYFMNQPLYQLGQLADKNIAAPAQPDNSNYWKMEEDIELYHFSHGEGPSILMLHGGPGMPFQNSLTGLNLLSDQYRIHYYDQRGSGRSSKPFDRFESKNFYQNMLQLDAKLGLSAHLEDIERIRQILGEEQLILLGHSFGGFLAALYAAEFPDHVKALILTSPAEVLVMPPPGGGLYESIGDHLPDDMKGDFNAYMEDYMDFKNIFQKSETELAELNDALGPYYEAAYKSKNPDVPQVNYPEASGWGTMGPFFSMGRKYDLRPDMEKVNAPVLVIHGANDLQTEEGSRLYVDAFPNATFKVIEGAGHFAFVEQAEVFAEAVKTFLHNTQL
jgi:proline iminopeptidase